MPILTNGNSQVTEGKNGTTTFEIPKTCKAGVVVNEGPGFTVQLEEMAVPEPGRIQSFLPPLSSNNYKTRGNSDIQGQDIHVHMQM